MQILVSDIASGTRGQAVYLNLRHSSPEFKVSRNCSSPREITSSTIVKLEVFYVSGLLSVIQQ